METTIAIYHEGAIAQYCVAKQSDGTFKAHLLQYQGIQGKMPPLCLDLQQSNRNSTAYTYQSLLEELGCVIQNTNGY